MQDGEGGREAVVTERPESPESPEHEHDLALIARFRDGDVDALDQLVRLHGRAVYSFIYRFLGPDPFVDDVYQDVWVRVTRSVARFGGRSRFTTWLFQITRNICIDHLRKRKRRGHHLSIDEPLHGGDEDDGPYRNAIAADQEPVEDAVAHKELIRHVEEAVAELPPEQKEIFLLRRSTDMTFEEISQMSGVPRNTVKSRMRYALENIRRFLKERNIGKEVVSNG